MISGGDSILAKRLSDQISERMVALTEQLVKVPTERTAGQIQGLREVLGMIGAVHDDLANPQQQKDSRIAR